MILLDVTIVNVALPSIQRELEVTSGTLVWTINAYALLDVDSPFLLAVPGYFRVGVGYGAAVPAISAVAMGAIEVVRAGVASGVLNTARQVGTAGALALAASRLTLAAQPRAGRLEAG